MSGPVSIIAHANCDDAYVVWRYPKAIPECRGFAPPPQQRELSFWLGE